MVVWRLDRLGRSIKDLIYLVEQLEDAGVGLKSLQENIDTTSTGGRLVFHLFAALAEFERNLIRERTHAGLSAARARGRLGGRKKRLDPAKRKDCRGFPGTDCERRLSRCAWTSWATCST